MCIEEKGEKGVGSIWMTGNLLKLKEVTRDERIIRDDSILNANLFTDLLENEGQR